MLTANNKFLLLIDFDVRIHTKAALKAADCTGVKLKHCRCASSLFIVQTEHNFTNEVVWAVRQDLLVSVME